MTKNNIRSFRYSDKVANILNDFEGKTFNQKFENLILHCFDKLETRKIELENIEKRLKEKREQLYNLDNRTHDVNVMINDLERLKRDIHTLASKPSLISENMKE